MKSQNTRAFVRPAEAEGDTLKITVVYTSDEATLSAMREAAVLANSLNAKLTLVYPEVVPYPRPLNNPPVALEFTEQRLRDLACHVSIDTDIRVCLCRDPQDALFTELSPETIIVLGGRKVWRPTAEKRLARTLRRAGHEVIFTETE